MIKMREQVSYRLWGWIDNWHVVIRINMQLSNCVKQQSPVSIQEGENCWSTICSPHEAPGGGGDRQDRQSAFHCPHELSICRSSILWVWDLCSPPISVLSMGLQLVQTDTYRSLLCSPQHSWYRSDDSRTTSRGGSHDTVRHASTHHT